MRIAQKIERERIDRGSRNPGRRTTRGDILQHGGVSSAEPRFD
jgi:hypothetical protein